MTDLKLLLRIRDFRYLWLAQIGSNFGDSLTYLTLLILVQRLTGSTVALAGLMISITLPTLLFSMISGVYVDRFDRKKLMILSDVLRAVLVLGFIWARTEAMVPLIYALAFGHAAVGTVFLPARAALLPRVVGEDKLLAANSVTQTTKIVLGVLGTATAGIFASAGDTLVAVFGLDSVTFLVSALLLTRVRTSGVPEEGADGKVWSEMVAGFRVMTSSRPLKGTLVSLAVALLGIGAVNVLIVPLIIDDLQVSEAFFGVIEAAQVAGMVLSGAAVAVLATRLNPSRLVSLGLIGVGVGVGAVAGVSAVWHLMVLLFVVGLSIGPTQAGVSTLAQTLVDDSMRGRVGGVMNAAVSGATVLSMGLAGVLAAAIGTRNVFLAAGLFSIAAGLLAMWFFRDLAFDGPAEQAESEVGSV